MTELLNALELCIKQIIKEQESINGPILDESDVLYDLCVGLEACLRHDMKFGQQQSTRGINNVAIISVPS